MGRTTYLLYLSDDDRGKLLEVLNPFIEDAETEATPAPRVTRSSGPSDADKERNKTVRWWARETKCKYENAAGEKVTLGEKGRIPDAVVKAWEAAGSPDIGEE